MRAGRVGRRHRVGAGAVRLHRLPRRAVREPHHAERRLHARSASVDPQHGRGHAQAARAGRRGRSSTSAADAAVDRWRARTCRSATRTGRRSALDNISFTIARGQSVGIVGPTGAGKSTLVDVLLGLLPPTTGRVLIDGEPLEGRERAWQRQIGYVSQDVYLLDDSLRRNIAFGIPDGAIDEARLARGGGAGAARRSRRARCRQRLETVVGENGVRLSGGQRQRVAIARALYHDPPVLFFDEATAALDNQTEREVTEAIAHLAKATVGSSARRSHRHRDRASAVDGEELRSVDLPSRRQARRRRHVPGTDERSGLPPADLTRRRCPETGDEAFSRKGRGVRLASALRSGSMSLRALTIRDSLHRFAFGRPQQRAFVVEHLGRAAAVMRKHQAYRRVSFRPSPCRSVRSPSPGCRNGTGPSAHSARRGTDPHGSRSTRRRRPRSDGCGMCSPRSTARADDDQARVGHRRCARPADDVIASSMRFEP